MIFKLELDLLIFSNLFIEGSDAVKLGRDMRLAALAPLFVHNYPLFSKESLLELLLLLVRL